MTQAPRLADADDAVSPVIGVILMVAITVVLAAVVFVLVSNLSQTSGKGEEAAIAARSPQAGILEITMVTGGTHGPYANTDATTANDYGVTVNGIACDLDAMPDAGITMPATWTPGGVLRFTSSGATPGGCAAQIVAGTQVSISVQIAGSLVHSGNVDIRM